MAAIKTLCLTSLFLIVSRISALQTGNDSKTACESSDVTIDFIFNIGNDSFAERLWYKNSVIPANRIARVVSAGPLTVESQYSGRIALSGSRGIILNNVTKTDSGSYLFIIVTDIYSELGTATTTVNVYVNPNASCMPTIEKDSADNYTCKISDACPGKDSIQAKWGDGSIGVFKCPKTTENTKYKCCPEGDPVTYCNSIGDLCTVFECPGSDKQCQPSESQLVLGLGLGLGLGIQCVFIIIVVVIFKCTGKNHEDNPQETDGTKPEQVPLEPTEVSSVQTCVGSEAKFSFKLTEDSNESAVLIKNKSYGVVMTARGKEGSSDDPFYKDRVNFTGNTYQKLISFILRKVTLSDAGIYIAVHSDPNLIIGCQALIVKGCKRARNLGLVLGLGLGIIFIVCCIIIASLILTGTTPCKNELGLGLGLGSGMPCVITIIIAVIFTFCSFPLFKGIPNIHDFGEGILDGFVIGIIVKRLKSHEQVPLEPTEVSSVQTCVGSEAHFNFMLTEDCNESAVHIKNKSGGVLMIARGKEGKSGDPVYKDRVNFTGNTDQKLISFILRNVTLSDAGIYIAVHSDPNIIIGCQVLIVKDTKGMTKNPGSSSAVSREQVQVQLEIKGFKDDEEERLE